MVMALCWGAMTELGVAQDTAQGRLITYFDFEERVTADWSHLFLQEPSLPPKGLFFSATGDPDRFVNGAMSLRLDLHGGSISYRTADHVVIPAQRNARYLVRAWVMTEKLEHAHARIEVRVVDQSRLTAQEGVVDDPVLAATVAEFASDPIQTNGQWQLVEVLLDTRSESARTGGELRIVPSLQVVQPAFIAPVDHNRLSPRVEDVVGFAWFDDLQVWRIPSVDFHTISAQTGMPTEGVSVMGERLAARVMIDDPIEPLPTVEIQILDLDGVTIYTDRFTARSDGIPIDRDLPVTYSGWYELRMRAFSGEETIAQRESSLVVVRNQPRSQHRTTPRFGFSFQDWSTSELPRLQSMLEVFDPSVVEFSIWPVRNDDAPVGDALVPMRRLLDVEREARREVLLALDRVHSSIAQTVGTEPSEIAVVFSSDPSAWVPEVESWLLACGTYVDRWRIAGLADGSAITSLPDPLVQLVEQLLSEPALSVPCQLGEPGIGDWPYFVAGSELSAKAQAKLFEANGKASGSEITIRISPPQEGWRRRDQIDEMARRIITAWRAGADRIMTPMPRVGSQVDPTTLAWASLGRALSGRRMEGELHVSDTATCLVANGDSGLLVVAYSDGPSESETIQIPLGSTTVSVESIDGREWTVANREGVHEIEVSSTPVVIRDANPEVVSLASSLRFHPQQVQSLRGPCDVELVLHNPFPNAVEGELEFIAPEGWSFEPARQHVRISADSDIRVPSTIRWDWIPQLGEESIQVKLLLLDGGNLDASVQVPLEIVSPGIEVEADWSLVKSAVTGNESVLVTLEVTNRSSEAMNLEAVAVAWRVGRKRAPISNLQPGESAIRRFEFQAGIDQLAGTEVRLSLHEVDGAAAVAISVPISSQGAATALVPVD